MNAAPAKPITIEEAVSIVCAHVAPGRTETVPVEQAVGRILAKDCTSDIDVTPFDDSAMDGFAVRCEDLATATAQNPVELTCVAHIGAGSYYPETLGAGQCVRIMTGAPVPAGADAVVRIEDVSFKGEGSTGSSIAFCARPKPGTNIRYAGEEAKAGSVVVAAGSLVRPAGVGLLASCGNLEVCVYARPVVGIITIGSELVDAREMPGPGMIRDSNVWAMQAYVAQAGGIAQVYPRVDDDVEHIKSVYLQAARECDVVVSTGGACMGDFDLTPGIVASLGELFFTRVSMKPGKSQPFGRIGTTPVFVLSGNPGAASTGFEMFVRPALLIMQGFTTIARPRVKARLAQSAIKNDSLLFLQRVIVSALPGGTFVASQLTKQSSALLGSFQEANCLIVIPEGFDGKQADELVECILTDASFEALPPSMQRKGQ